MHPNLKRFDLANTLIHFTRRIDLVDNDAPPELPQDNWGWGEMVEDTTLSPFFLLRRIVRRRQILSTHSYRGEKPTIYGPAPAVCFTEMPVGAFVLAATKRQARGENMSPYAILLPKAQAFAHGARPVIYGTSVQVRDHFDDWGHRRLDPPVFHDAELFRYVAYNPSGTRLLDWTHEREWRWPNRNWVAPPAPQDDAYQDWLRQQDLDRVETDGLVLDGGVFSDLGLIVKTDRQAKLLVHDILRAVDAGRSTPDLFTHILQVPALLGTPDLHDPAVVEQVITDGALDLREYLTVSRAEVDHAERVYNETDEVLRNAGIVDRATDGRGRSAVWLLDNAAPPVRALVMLGRVELAPEGRYLMELPFLDEVEDARTKQTLAEIAAREVERRLGTPATYWTVLGAGKGWSDAPSYTNVSKPDELWFNCAHDKDDF